MKINLHTHTTWCDGKNTAEEMVTAAIEKKFDILGFSGHSMFPFGGKWHIQPKDFTSYTEEIRHLEKKYKDKISIKLGFECDFFPSLTLPSREFYKELEPDFLIGAVHYVATKDGHYSVDAATERVQRGLEVLYKGNGKQAVIDYFEAERTMLRNGNFDILAHPDLIRIRNGKLNFFDENESWYREQIKLTAKEVARNGCIVEINTGAISRGTMDDVYPSADFLQMLHDEGCPVIISSDAHRTDMLDAAFDRAVAAAEKAGYSEIHYPEAGHFVSVRLSDFKL